MTSEPSSGGDSVTLVVPDDRAQQALIESVLADFDITYSVQNEQTQHLIGYGDVGGYNVAIGPPEIRVPRTQLALARQVVAAALAADVAEANELQSADSIAEGDQTARRYARQSAILAVLWLGGAGSLAAVYLGGKALDGFASATAVDRRLAIFGMVYGLIGVAATLIALIQTFG